jgi:hypothetical protein
MRRKPVSGAAIVKPLGFPGSEKFQRGGRGEKRKQSANQRIFSWFSPRRRVRRD